jgi:hypothetical protein
MICKRIYEARRLHKFHIIPFIASLLICSFACNSLGDTPQIRLSVQAQGDNGDDARMVSALSREFRKLDGVLVTDTQPTLKITCMVIRLTARGGKLRTGCASSTAVTDADDHLITHIAQSGRDIDQVAHEIAISFDGTLIEEMRRAAQPSPTS